MNNRIMIVGTGSGSGKTTVTIAILKVLLDMGLDVSSFKCGPDYIDPMFHSQVLGTKSRNLDIFLCGESMTKSLFVKNAKEISVVEGVMGMYDGLGLDNEEFSSNHLSQLTDTKEILVVNTKGKSHSILAELYGYCNFKKNNICGFILNNCSDMMYGTYKKIIENEFALPVLGYLPNMPQVCLESRHLGLVTAEETDNLKGKIELLAKTASKSIDFHKIIAIASESTPIQCDEIVIKQEKSVKIGVAKDKAFCFYYEDNFDILRELGAEIVYFSPLLDEKIPENCDGLYLGGGYPELYIKELSQNKSMLESIGTAIEQGLPTFAECGGFMYLGTKIEEGEMVGAISSTFHMTSKLTRFGYAQIQAKRDNILCGKGETINVHEFHYSDGDDNGDTFTAIKKNGKQWDCFISHKNLICGYPHIHFGGNLNFARNFVRTCGEYREKKV